MNRIFYFFGLCVLLGLAGCSCEREGKDKTVSSADGQIEKRSAKTKKKNDRKKRQAAALRKKIRAVRTADVDGLLKALNDRNEKVRAAAVRNFDRLEPETLKDEKVITALTKGLVDKSMTVRRLSKRALVKIGEPAIPTVVAALRSDHPDAKKGFKRGKRNLHLRDTAKQTVIAMGKITVPALTEALASDDRFQRVHAASALGYIGMDAETAVPVMIKMAKDEDWFVRRAMVANMAKIAPEDPAVKRVVTKSQKDENEKVQQSATSALEKMAAAKEAAAAPSAV